MDTSVTSGGSTTSDALGGLGAATNGVNAITIPDATQKTAGNAFSFATSYTQGDTVPTSAPTVGAVPALVMSPVQLQALGDLAGTINTAGAMTIHGWRSQYNGYRSSHYGADHTVKRLIVLLLLPSSAMAVPVVPKLQPRSRLIPHRVQNDCQRVDRLESYPHGFEYTVSGTGDRTNQRQRQPTISGNKINLSSRSSWKQTVNEVLRSSSHRNAE